ncbi:MAG: PTS sugar transporter subunit IIA [Treponema sp.]|jgi:PTS system nitrogen regulatory IIA component|nr:PTS sugar transporter subunit IIA [Treponema sp.]MBQ5847927.1 PTS sugar transporter subunit IIA [Treponema sp.]
MITDLTSLISKGGVFTVEGSSTTEIYEKVCKLIKFPESITSDAVFNALCAREKIMSTAVGNGIALPHASVPIIKEEEEQRVCVVYLKEPLDMNAPDEMKVHTMFVILTQNRQTHLQVLSRLVSLLRDTSFLKLLENQANGVDLIEKIKELY